MLVETLPNTVIFFITMLFLKIFLMPLKIINSPTSIVIFSSRINSKYSTALGLYRYCCIPITFYLAGNNLKRGKQRWTVLTTWKIKPLILYFRIRCWICQHAGTNRGENELLTQLDEVAVITMSLCFAGNQVSLYFVSQTCW